MMQQKKLIVWIGVMILLIGGIFWWWKKNTGGQAGSQTAVEQPPDVTKFKPIEAMYAIFFTDANIPDRRRTNVQIPYYYEKGGHREVALTLAMEEGVPGVVVLVDHPVFEKMTWQRLDSPSASLYQKNPKYTTVAEFWNNPPKDAKVLADPYLAYRDQLKGIPSITALTADVNFEEYDYLITTYREPEDKGTYRIFETTVDASKANLDENNKLMWKLDIPDNGPENKVYLGEIHVDYRVGL